MVAPNRLSSVVACPPALEGWKAISDFPRANLNDKSPQVLAKGLPQGSFCQKKDPSSGTASYFVRADAANFVTLLLTPPKVSLLMPPPASDEDVDVAMALVTARRHPEPLDALQVTSFEKNPPSIVDPELAGIEWVVVDANLTPSLVALLRCEMTDSDNSLFRQAQRGVSYYVTTDVEKLSRMVSLLQEIKRDLSELGQQDLAGDVNQVAVQLTYVQSHLQATQPFWKKPFRDLWPVAVMGVIAVVGGGWGFAEGMDLAHGRKQLFAKIVDWIRNNRNPPSSGTGGEGVTLKRISTSTPVAPPSTEFSTLDDRVDSGEQADFQNDPTRAYDPIQHIHVNGTAIAAAVVAGGVLLLLPEILPILAVTSPETITLVTGLGAFAASH